jgi:serine/threonine-protein kinase
LVALKRARPRREAYARIKREIEAQKKLAHPNVMPIWDHDPGFRWYTMPIAEGSLKELRSYLGDEDLESILFDLGSALRVAHDYDLIHRDISPHNVLALTGGPTGQFRWVVADWGMVRIAPGKHSRTLTRTGQRMGTPGYDAPELDVNPSEARPAVDVYSLGRVAAWFLTGKEPRPGVPLLPESDNTLHWRHFVRECTQQDARQRVASMGHLVQLLGDVANHREEPVLVRAERLSLEVHDGDNDSLVGLVALAETYPENTDLFLDYIARVPSGRINTWVLSEPARATHLTITMCDHVIGPSWGDRDRQYVETPLLFSLGIIRLLAEMRLYGLLQDAAIAYFKADTHWAYGPQRVRTLEWLAELSDQSARAIAREMSNETEVVTYYQEPGWRPRSAVLTDLLTACS